MISIPSGAFLSENLTSFASAPGISCIGCIVREMRQLDPFMALTLKEMLYDLQSALLHLTQQNGNIEQEL